MSAIQVLHQFRIPLQLSPADASKLACLLVSPKELTSMDEAFLGLVRSTLTLHILEASWTWQDGIVLQELALSIAELAKTNPILSDEALESTLKTVFQPPADRPWAQQIAEECVEHARTAYAKLRPLLPEHGQSVHAVCVAATSSALVQDSGKKAHAILRWLRDLDFAQAEKLLRVLEAAPVSVEEGPSSMPAELLQTLQSGTPSRLFQEMLLAVSQAGAEYAHANATSDAGTSLAPPNAPTSGSEVKDARAQAPEAPSFALFQPMEARLLLASQPMQQAPGEGNSQQQRLLMDMSHESGKRPLTQCVNSAEALQSLRERFPHFRDVIDYIERALAIASCGSAGSPLRVPPILLRGGPGTGKTYFSQEFARVMGAEFHERDLSVTTDAFVLTGSDSTWRGAKPGLVFQALVRGRTANPVVLLNEVDKSPQRGGGNAAISAMYALLEPASASRFLDEFVPVAVNASAVIWMLTANDGAIPEPVLSRLEVFEIPSPTAEQSRAIARSVWKDLCSSALPAGHSFSPELPEDVCTELASCTPRVMRKALMQACGMAAIRHETALRVDDVQACTRRSKGPVRPSIGFVRERD